MKKTKLKKQGVIVRIDKAYPFPVINRTGTKPEIKNYGCSFDPMEIGIDEDQYSYDPSDDEHGDYGYGSGNPHDS